MGDSELKKNFLSWPVWQRGLFMLLFALIYSVAEVVIAAVVIFQFIGMLILARTNEQLLRLGQSLSTYIYEILLFLTFKSETKPYPFDKWPKGPPVADEPKVKSVKKTASKKKAVTKKKSE